MRKKNQEKTKNKRPTTAPCKKKLFDVLSEKSDECSDIMSVQNSEDLEDDTITYGNFVLVKYNNEKTQSSLLGV